MAQLRRAVKDGHLFILAGPSQGTWQVGEKGEQWLLQNHYPIPAEDEYVDLDAGTFSYLKDKGYLYIYGIQYDQNSRDAAFDIDQEFVRIARGLPLLLQLKERKEPAWELYLDLSELNEEVWEELQSHQTDSVTASNALASISLKQIIYTHSLLRVYPFPHPYQIYSSHSVNNKRVLQQAPETPGLNGNWQGNIFLERVTQAGTWQRRVPGSTVSFSGELLWLAKPDCNLDWPGQATRIGNSYVGWLLWRLTVNETAPVSWEFIQNWFTYRSINVSPQRQRLEIVSLPSAVTEDGQYIIEPGKSIWIVCYPSSRHTHGIFREIALSAEQIPSTAHNTHPPSKSFSALYPADRVNYFRWLTGQPGDYRIRVQGDASGEPLLVQVDTLPISRPLWLCGLSCTAMSSEHQHTFHAFYDFLDSGEEIHLLNQFAKQELAALTWTYEPEGLPVHVTWGYIPSHGLQQHVSNYHIQSSEELTRCWREHICPTLADGIQAKVTLDSGSYGCIELSITLPQQQPVELAWWNNERLVAQFTWLSQIIGRKYNQESIPMPGLLRETLLELCTQANEMPSLRTTLERLALANTLPAWVLIRLQTLIAGVENIGQNPIQCR
jgi:hypothetical protein